MHRPTPQKLGRFAPRPAHQVRVDDAQSRLVRDDQQRLRVRLQLVHQRVQPRNQVEVRLAARVPVPELVALPQLALCVVPRFNLVVRHALVVAREDLVQVAVDARRHLVPHGPPRELEDGVRDVTRGVNRPRQRRRPEARGADRDVADAAVSRHDWVRPPKERPRRLALGGGARVGGRLAVLVGLDDGPHSCWHPVAEPLRVRLAGGGEPRVATDLLLQIVDRLPVPREVDGAPERVHVREVFHDLHQQEPADLVRHHFFAIVDELDVRQVVLAAVVLQRDKHARKFADALLRRQHSRVAVQTARELHTLPQKLCHNVLVLDDDFDEQQLDANSQAVQVLLHGPARLLAAAAPQVRARLKSVRRVQHGDAAAVDVLLQSVQRVVVDALQLRPQQLASRRRVLLLEVRAHVVADAHVGAGVVGRGEVEEAALRAVEELQVSAQALGHVLLAARGQADEADDVPLADGAGHARGRRGHGGGHRVFVRSVK
mmetsp:Transcript_28842/g.99525  ORF Transcript_28842/g.99525 Transcript_28842/m.99525 type:complete len:488 (-) Transcript_28842:136-1599(-)